MALVPRSSYRTWWDDIDRYHRELDDHFRQLTLRDPWKIPPFPKVRFFDTFPYHRRLFDSLDLQVGGSATVERDENKYQLIVNMQYFTPEEITVRTDDRYITIEAKHEEQRDRYRSQSYLSKEFMRRYLLPKGYDITNIKPSLSSDGILTITAPRYSWWTPGERYVPIQRTYRPAIKAA